MLENERRWGIALHGGAGALPQSISPERREQYRAALEHALRIGEAVLIDGGTALDAVEQTVIALENDPCLNAGRGSAFNEKGFHQLDASIMDGQTLACGAVAAVQRIKNPIRAARAVMEKTPHVLLTGEGADEFAAANRLEMVSRNYFHDPVRWAQLNKALQNQGKRPLASPPYELESAADLPGDPTDLDLSRGTVGCVARDQHGHVAAATSTGGMTAKQVGRVGDTAIIGAGTYADDSGCAVSCTGNGEEFIRHSIAFQVNWRVRNGGQSLEMAVHDCLTQVLRPDDGGIIAISRTGDLVLLRNTEAMSRGWSDSTGNRGIAIWDLPFPDRGDCSPE